MSHRYVLRSIPPAERTRWNHFVCEHPWGHLLQSWEWGELKAKSGWHPLRLALWDAEQNEILAAAQVLRKGFGRVPLWAPSRSEEPPCLFCRSKKLSR